MVDCSHLMLIFNNKWSIAKSEAQYGGLSELPKVLTTIDKYWDASVRDIKLGQTQLAVEDGLSKRRKLEQESTGNTKDMKNKAKGRRGLSQDLDDSLPKRNNSEQTWLLTTNSGY